MFLVPSVIRRHPIPAPQHCEMAVECLVFCQEIRAERTMRHSFEPTGRAPIVPALAVALAAVLCGCHQTKVPIATQSDVAAAQEEARKELEQARLEARKDVKSAVKVTGETGGDAKNVAVARKTGSFDIAMAQADGDHKVAIVKCMTLDLAAQQPCKDLADAQFQTATAQAKAMRLASGTRG
jgi:hypothetical protein